MLAFMEELKKNWENRNKVVIATVVNTVGSTYRQVGAKSIFYEDGRFEGVLSGGCVEGDIFEHCKAVLESGEPRHIFYNLQDDDPIFGFGVGCDGGMEIFLQIFDPINQSKSAQNIINVYSNALKSDDNYRVLTVLDSDDETTITPGTLSIFDKDTMSIVLNKQDQKYFITFNDSDYDDFSQFTIHALSESGKNEIEINCFLETIRPIPQLLILGGGHDAITLAEQAKHLNWFVTVADYRSAHVEGKMFDMADKRILCSNEENFGNLSFEGDISVVIMSHNFEKDQFYLEQLYSKKFSYLGILGSRKRTIKLLDSLCVIYSKENIHFPVGLDIGSEGPEEIALSILAEILKVKNNKNGKSLIQKSGAIHG
ncbi:XdhC family protein [Salinicoccus sp. HZC-1]|uniref:XdhC family protein n=1 Tax=Salinicoccus sp. HZC-1 TaxID=3385497 RepID=UPI00398A60E3